MTKKSYNGYILDLFEGDVEAITSVEKALNNINNTINGFVAALIIYFNKMKKKGV